MRAALPALLLLMAGCASSLPAPGAEEAAPVDGLYAVAVRVVPINHTQSWSGALASAPCDVRSGTPCERPWLAQPPVQAGLKADAAERGIVEPRVLFWRLAVELAFQPGTSGVLLEFTAFATTPDGHRRELLKASGAEGILVPRTDLFLEEKETGLRLVLACLDGCETTAARPVGYDGTVRAQAFIPAGDAPVLLQQPAERSKE